MGLRALISSSTSTPANVVRQLVRPGDSIALDSSALGLELARHLATIDDLTVTTCGLEVADLLVRTSDHRVQLVGGQVHRATRSIIGGGRLQPNVPIGKGFFGGSAYSDSNGLLERENSIATEKRALAMHCRYRYGLVHPAMVGAFGPYHCLPAATLTQVFLVDLPKHDPEFLPVDRSHHPNDSPALTIAPVG